jgi:hypothetical protein
LQAKLVEALTDVAWAEAQGTYGVSTDYGIGVLFQDLTAVSAFIQNLVVESLDVVDTSDRRIQIDNTVGMLATDSSSNIIHDIPISPITTNFTYAGHLIVKSNSSVSFSYNYNTGGSSPQTATHLIDVSSLIGNSNAKAILIVMYWLLTETGAGNWSVDISFQSSYAGGTATLINRQNQYYRSINQVIIPIVRDTNDVPFIRLSSTMTRSSTNVIPGFSFIICGEYV